MASRSSGVTVTACGIAAEPNWPKRFLITEYINLAKCASNFQKELNKQDNLTLHRPPQQAHLSSVRSQLDVLEWAASDVDFASPTRGA